MPDQEALPAGRLLTADFFDRSALEVAPDLLGKLVVHALDGRPRWGRVVEVEAYCGPHDRAAHSWRGPTPRTAAMFGPPGHAYVYFIYGMHHCLNFVCQPPGVPEAVLVRALEPGGDTGRCAGPGLICRALGIDRSLTGTALAPPGVHVLDDGRRPGPIHQTPRIGVDYAGEWKDRPWRYLVPSPHLSKRLRISA